jgi:HlyD family secretion protein
MGNQRARRRVQGLEMAANSVLRSFRLRAERIWRAWSVAVGPVSARPFSACIGLGGVVLVALGAVWLAHGSTRPVAGGDAAGLALREGVVVRRDVEDVFLISGETRALRSFEVQTPLTEAYQLQIRWLAEDGAEVGEGEALVEFDSTALVQTLEDKRLQLSQAEAALAGRERTQAAELEKKRAALALAEIEVQKARLDAEVPESLRSRREWHQMQTKLHDCEAAYKKARQELSTFELTTRADAANLRLAFKKSERDLAASERALSLLSVRAPRPGIFVVAQHPRYWSEDRKLQVGDTMWPGTSVASIPDLNEMEIIALLPAVDERQIAPGQKARCILDSYPDQVFEGRVEDVSPVAREERERSGFPVRISLGRCDPKIMRPGMSVRVEVVRRRWEAAVAVSRSAVAWRAGRASVRRAGGRETPIEVEGCTPTECIVISGLGEGEHVAL